MCRYEHDYGDNNVTEVDVHVADMLDDACHEALVASINTGDCYVVFLNRAIPNVLPTSDPYVQRLRTLEYVVEYFQAIPWLVPNSHLTFHELFGRC